MGHGGGWGVEEYKARSRNPPQEPRCQAGQAPSRDRRWRSAQCAATSLVDLSLRHPVADPIGPSARPPSKGMATTWRARETLQRQDSAATEVSRTSFRRAGGRIPAEVWKTRRQSVHDFGKGPPAGGRLGKFARDHVRRHDRRHLTQKRGSVPRSCAPTTEGVLSRRSAASPFSTPRTRPRSLTTRARALLSE